MDQITTLFVSLGLLTTLSFDSEITSYMYGGAQEDLFIKVTNNRKTLALKPKGEKLNSNLLIITKERKFYFNVRHSKDNPHEFIEVKSGQINHAMKKILSTVNYDLLEGVSSFLVINKNKKSLNVNNIMITKKKYLSKGVPIFIGGKRILY
jgi:type IV secretory pathway VirB9-like protein